MPKRPTLQDVAEAAGVAPATVSYALRGTRGSVETRRRVQEAAETLGYHADPIARALASGRSELVCVLCGSMRDPWQQAVVAHLARTLLTERRHSMIADADGDADRERALADRLRAQRPDGMFVAPIDPTAEHWAALADQTPIVSLGDQLPDAPAAGAVVFDNARGIESVLNLLADLGHRHILVAVPARPRTPDRPAERAVTEHSRRLGLETSMLEVAPTSTAAETTSSIRVALTDRVAPPSAVFGLSDAFAFSALRAARAAGLRVPEQVSVVGFENVDQADLVGPGLTTVDWDLPGLVDTAVRLLLDLVAGRSEPVTRVIDPRLVLRGSTGPSPR